MLPIDTWILWHIGQWKDWKSGKSSPPFSPQTAHTPKIPRSHRRSVGSLRYHRSAVFDQETLRTEVVHWHRENYKHHFDIASHQPCILWPRCCLQVLQTLFAKRNSRSKFGWWRNKTPHLVNDLKIMGSLSSDVLQSLKQLYHWNYYNTYICYDQHKWFEYNLLPISAFSYLYLLTCFGFLHLRYLI